MFPWPKLELPFNNFARGTRFLLDRGVDLCYPPECAICRCELAGPLLVCPSCRAAMLDERPACPRCAADVPSPVTADETCPQCRLHVPRFAAAVRLGRYEAVLRTAILRMKHAGREVLVDALARLLCQERGDQLEALGVDVVVPMPMHWARRLVRGSNAPDVLARRVAARLGVPAAGHLLIRRRHTRPQTGLARSRRLENVRGAIVARGHVDLPGARVLMVDDVMTTGATADQAARALRQAGAAFVAVAVLARAEGLG